MRKHLLYIFFLFVLFFVQSSWLTAAEGRIFLVPQLLLLFVVVYSMTHALPQSLWYAFLAGLLLELWSGLFFGSYIFGLTVTATLVYFVTRNLTVQELRFWSGMTLVACATPALSLMLFFYQRVFTWFGLASSVSREDLISSGLIYLVIFNLVLYWPISIVFKLLPQDDPSSIV